MQYIDSLLKELSIPNISSNRRYWSVRTGSGRFWKQFISENFIAINWNEISDLNQLKQTAANKEVERVLKEKIQKLYEIEQGGRILNQIKNFVFNMGPGDIVMIPSLNSEIISFGEIVSETFIYSLTDEDLDKERCHFIKRRKIKWLKNICKSNLDPVLFKMLQTHQTISNADNYAHQIDRTLELLYYKDGKCHLTLLVTRKGNIKGKDLFALQKLVYDSLDIEHDSLETKINVQSTGPIEFISDNIWTIIGVLIFVAIAIGGGKFLGVEMPGILHWWYKFSTANKSHEIENQKLQLEREKFEFEKEKHEIAEIRKKYQTHLEKLMLEIPDNLNNLNLVHLKILEEESNEQIS